MRWLGAPGGYTLLAWMMLDGHVSTDILRSILGRILQLYRSSTAAELVGLCNGRAILNIEYTVRIT